MRRVWAGVVPLTLAVAAACGGAPGGFVTTTGDIPNDWLGSGPTVAIYAQWTRTGTQLAGTLHEDDLPSNATSLTSYDAAFTGLLNGGNLTLTFPEGLGSIKSLAGTVSGGAMTLDVPQPDGTIQLVRLSPGTIAQFDAAVGTLQTAASANANASAAAAAAASPPAPVVDSPAPTAATEGDPAQVVWNYFAAINAHEWAQVWAIGGENLGGSYASMVAGYAHTARDDAYIDAVNGNTVTVALLAYQTSGVAQLYLGSYSVAAGSIATGSLSLQTTDTGTGYQTLAQSWSGHDRTLEITPGGLGIVSYRVYSWCSADPTPPCDGLSGSEIINGGLIAFQLAGATGPGLSGAILTSTDPTQGGSLPVTYDAGTDTITLSIFNDAPFCGSHAPANYCGM